MSQETLVFPDSVVALWKHARHEAVLSDEQVVSLWKTLKRLVSKDANYCAQQFGLDAEDLAEDFVVSLISGSCPDQITAVGTLLRCAKKFWVEK